MSKILIRFKASDEQYNKDLFFNEDVIIKDALILFLKEINRFEDLSPEKIAFLSGAKILNKPELLNKQLKKVINIRSNVIIKVIECDNIIGGGGDAIDFCNLQKG